MVGANGGKLSAILHIRAYVLVLPLALVAASVNAAIPDALAARLEALDSLEALRDFDQRAPATLDSPLERAELLRLIGYRYESFNAKDLAYDAFDRSVRLLEPLPPSGQLVYSLGERSYITYLRSGDREDYCPDRERAVAVARQLAAPEVLVSALVKRAFCYDQLETMQQATGDLQEAMQIARRENLAEDAQAMIFNASGNLFRVLKLYDRAYAAYHNAYLLWRAGDEVPDYFNMLHNLVGEAIPLGRWAEAEQHLAEMRQVAEHSGGDNDYAFFAAFNAGRLALAKGDYPRAESAFDQALELAPTTVETRFVAHSRLLRAEARFWRQDLAGARRDLDDYNQVEKEPGQEFRFYRDLAEALQQGDQAALLTVLQAWRAQEQSERFAFLDSNTRFFTDEHERQVAAYEADLLKQQVTLQDLELARAGDQARLASQANLILGLVVLILLGLALWLGYLLRKHSNRAYTDFLTGVANRARVFERGSRLFLHALKRQRPLAVVLIDIDYFKQVNDRFGHEVGDRALRSTVATLSNCLHGGELLGRLGGEEFIVILPGHHSGQASERAEGMRVAIKQRAGFEHSGGIPVQFSASFGVAADSGAECFQDLVNMADAALYQAKSSGRDRVCAFDPSDARDAAVVGSRKAPRG